MDERINKDEDSSLIKDFLSGKSGEYAFEKLVLKYKDRVFNLCLRFLGNYAEADDSAQEVFLRVYRSLKGFKFQALFSTWLYRITVNVCKNKMVSLEYRYKSKMVYLDAPLQTEEGDCNLEIGDESLSPVTEILKREKEDLIQGAINSLPADQKAVVALRDIEMLSYEEIAKITGFNIGTVKSKLSRARQALCEKLRRLI
jgi:RNA polymerase sigma-70 factor (ECF subfamily)